MGNGWWKLEYWKKDDEGNDIKINDIDRHHIGEALIGGCNEGELCYEEGDEKESSYD